MPGEIGHPVVRALIQHYNLVEPLDISIMADLPARSGLGSSSSFTVGMINLISHIKRRPVTKLDLARAAVFVERELLSENVGVQDQYHAAFGGLNKFDFEGGSRKDQPSANDGIVPDRADSVAIPPVHRRDALRIGYAGGADREYTKRDASIRSCRICWP